jgi:choline dehydrogenase-like flavoprotein
VPFVDANKDLASFEAGGFDQIVVGAGAAGILVALELAAKGQRVLLLESGHFEPDPARQALNEMEQVGKPFGDANWTRHRIIGGTTTVWGGQSAPFPAEEFKQRDWIEHSGWPIGLEDLAPYYPTADRYMGLPPLYEAEDLHRRLGNRPPAFDPAQLHYHYSKWAPQPNFYKAHRRRLEREVVLLFNAQLLRIDLGTDGRASAIEVGNFNELRRMLPVSGSLVLTVGGIETNRILLLNNHQRPGGLGAEGGWLGRAFMEHPCIEGGFIRNSNPLALQAALGSRLHRGVRYSARVGSSGQWQEKQRLPSIIGGIMWLYEDGDIGPLSHLRGFVRRPTVRGLGKVGSNVGRLVPGLWMLATRGLVYKPGAVAQLVFCIEQAPGRDSRIGLSERLDPFGKALAKLDWRIGQQTWDTLVAYAQTFTDELGRLGLGEVELLDHIRADEPDWRRHLSDVNHHMGGARMSAAAADGVVDPDLRVWGVPNLYVCSSAVFPTGYHSNPTLTVLALGARLAERLAGR